MVLPDPQPPTAAFKDTSLNDYQNGTEKPNGLDGASSLIDTSDLLSEVVCLFNGLMSVF